MIPAEEDGRREVRGEGACLDRHGDSQGLWCFCVSACCAPVVFRRYVQVAAQHAVVFPDYAWVGDATTRSV